MDFGHLIALYGKLYFQNRPDHVLSICGHQKYFFVLHLFRTH